MRALGGILFTILGFGVILIFALATLEDGTASRNYAEAAKADAWGRAQTMIIQAQAQSSLQSAQATAITSAAMLPWGVLGVLGLLGLAVVALCVVIVIRPVKQPVLVERQIFYLPAPGQRRGEVWQVLAEPRPGALIVPSEKIGVHHDYS